MVGAGAPRPPPPTWCRGGTRRRSGRARGAPAWGDVAFQRRARGEESRVPAARLGRVPKGEGGPARRLEEERVDVGLRLVDAVLLDEVLRAESGASGGRPRLCAHLIHNARGLVGRGSRALQAATHVRPEVGKVVVRIHVIQRQNKVYKRLPRARICEVRVAGRNGARRLARRRHK